mmetsp:Transcript_49377/g.99424  ORF Transcript_49377/g.99424 Transcript_49377/m.99424 type:complete len:222 (+) Transcript_49377:1-666(+)
MTRRRTSKSEDDAPAPCPQSSSAFLFAPGRSPSDGNGLPPWYCSQLLLLHSTPSLGPSIKCSWNVSRGLSLLLGRLRWSTCPWMTTRSPDVHSTGMKPLAFSPSLGGSEPAGIFPSHSQASRLEFSPCSTCSKTICGASFSPSSKCFGFRTKRRRKGSLCDPGLTHKQPFWSVAGSSASQRPRQVSRGVVCRKDESWWDVTSPPMTGCLKMYIDCGTTASL